MADSIWTPEALKHHFDSIMEAHERTNKVLHAADTANLNARFESLERSITVAQEAAMRAQDISNNSAEKWRENANEWRGSMTDRERNFATTSDMLSLKERLDKLEGRGHGMRDLWGWLVAGVLLLINLLQNVRIGKL